MAGFHLVTGLMGAGKTYYGVEIIRKALSEGAMIHSNVPLEWDKLRLEFPSELLVQLPDDPATWCRKGDEAKGEPMVVSDMITGGAEGAENLVVIDEASLAFDVDQQGERSEKERLRPIFQLIALTRHVGLDIYFLAQDAANVNAKIRRMAATRTNCVNAGKLPFVGWIMKPVFGDFLRVYFAKGDSKPFGRSWARFSKVIGESYRTHGMASSVGMRLNPTRKKGGDALASRGKKGCLIMGGLMLVLFIGGSWVGMSRFRNLGKRTAEAEPEAVTPSPSPTPLFAGAAPAGKGDKTPPRGGLRMIEWDAADEFVISSVRKTAGGLVISTRNGPRLAVGADWLGERLTSMMVHRGWYYFVGELGRVTVARPAHPSEREEWRLEQVEHQRLAREKLAEQPETLLDAAKGGIETL